MIEFNLYLNFTGDLKPEQMNHIYQDGKIISIFILSY